LKNEGLIFLAGEPSFESCDGRLSAPTVAPPSKATPVLAPMTADLKRSPAEESPFEAFCSQFYETVSAELYGWNLIF
jgi:hypothetical protein